MNGTCLPVINFYKQNDEYFIYFFPEDSNYFLTIYKIFYLKPYHYEKKKKKKSGRKNP